MPYFSTSVASPTHPSFCVLVGLLSRHPTEICGMPLFITVLAVHFPALSFVMKATLGAFWQVSNIWSCRHWGSRDGGGMECHCLLSFGRSLIWGVVAGTYSGCPWLLLRLELSAPFPLLFVLLAPRCAMTAVTAAVTAIWNVVGSIYRTSVAPVCWLPSCVGMILFREWPPLFSVLWWLSRL